MLQEINSDRISVWLLIEARESAKGNAYPLRARFCLERLSVWFTHFVLFNDAPNRKDERRRMEPAASPLISFPALNDSVWRHLCCLKMKALLLVRVWDFRSWLSYQRRGQKAGSSTGTILRLGIYGHSRSNSLPFLVIGLLLPYLLKNPAFLPHGCYYCGAITHGYH